jgi:endoglucanase
MRPRRLIPILAAILLAATLASAQNHPFPRHVTYPGAKIRPNHVSQTQQDNDVRAFYHHWKANYLVSAGTAADGTPMYRVTMGSGQSSRTTSEGQGFGMTITVLMAGYDPQAQAIFNGLWKFARTYPSAIDSRLMNWEVPVNASASSAAFDGDCDIAYALLLAHNQWGSSGAVNYSAAATTLIRAIKESMIGAQSGLPLLGDWVKGTSDPKYNQYAPRSSDFMLANFRAFASFTGESIWSTVIANSQATINSLQTNYSPSTGLLPDFIEPTSSTNTTPKPARPYFLESANDGNYYYNAARVPWRIALDALLHNNATSAAQAGKISTWAQSKFSGNANLITPGYMLNGTSIHPTWAYTNLFAAPFGVAAMTKSTQQAWLNAIYDRVVATRENYYEDSVALICLLIMTGNHWDTTTSAPDTTPPAVQTTYPVSGSTITGDLTRVSGTASDNASGVDRVEIVLYRQVGPDNWEFWNGSFWHWDDPPMSTTLNTSVTPNTWTRTSGFPTGANFPAGRYYVRAIAYDKQGNVSAPYYIEFNKQ